MKNVALSLFVLLMGAGCMKQTAKNRAEHASPMQSARHEPASITPTPNETATPSKDGAAVPLAFAAVDFKNYSYPTNLRGKVTLKDGTRKYERPEGGGGDTFELRKVHYADITGNEKEEAVVHLLQVSCGASCDGGSHLFYFYSADRNKARLLSRMETGSAAYDECALKSFIMTKERLTVELFRVCRARGRSFHSRDDGSTKGKFEAHSFTRFLYRFDGSRFLLRRREVFPFAEGNVMNHEETVIVGGV